MFYNIFNGLQEDCDIAQPKKLKDKKYRLGRGEQFKTNSF